jgi:acyl carrier protein
MEEAAIYEKVRPIISSKLKVDADSVQLGTAFGELGADSLDVIELAIELEETFRVSIPDRDYGGLKTVGDAVSYIAARIASAA